MARPRLVLCNRANLPAEHADLGNERQELHLDSLNNNANVTIRLEDVTDFFWKTLTPRIVDLLEIASFVYAADSSVSRGTGWTDKSSTESWSRDFVIVVPVRDIRFWQTPDITGIIEDILRFFTNDKWHFIFTKLEKDRAIQEYLGLQDDEWPFSEVERVVLFSGGLDSLAGVLDCAASGERLVLVSHRPVSTMDHRQRQLYDLLQARFPGQLLRIPVWVNKASASRESTQRSRSFLFTSLGVAVASVMKCKGIRFYENGVVSLNLPVADEVLRARASRTTHPVALAMLTNLASLVLERSVEVDNPFLFLTKQEVVTLIADRGAADLIGHSCSCLHSFFKSRAQHHCGTCSQCIDRRVAVLAAGQEEFDDAEDYVSDVFTGPRKEGYERNIAVDYARHALELKTMTPEEVAHQFNLELTRAVRPMVNKRENAERLIALHKRHGEAAYKVITGELADKAAELLEGKLNSTSMLAMIGNGLHLHSSWERFAGRIGDLLAAALPVAFEKEKPLKEVALQRIADSILIGHDLNLVREYPFLRWSSVLTKPDWSHAELDLLIEAKLVKDRKDLHRITEEIAADITKYGDSGQRVMFVVYDSSHCILKEDEFAEPINRRDSMFVRIIR